jgi:hypothetical protein
MSAAKSRKVAEHANANLRFRTDAGAVCGILWRLIPLSRALCHDGGSECSASTARRTGTVEPGGSDRTNGTCTDGGRTRRDVDGVAHHGLQAGESGTHSGFQDRHVRSVRSANRGDLAAKDVVPYESWFRAFRFRMGEFTSELPVIQGRLTTSARLPHRVKSKFT